MSFELRDGGYDIRDHQVRGEAPERTVFQDVTEAIEKRVTTVEQSVNEQSTRIERIESKVDTLDQLREVLPLHPDLVLLDNMSPELCAQAVAIVAGATKLEASGGITIDNARAYADSGVDFIAIGALTHSASVLDFGLDLRAE